MGASIKPRRRDLRSAARRRRDLRASLTAAAQIVPTYDMVYGSPSGRFFAEAALQAGFADHASSSWPVEGLTLDLRQSIFRENDSAVYRLDDGTLFSVHLGHGWCEVRVAAADQQRIGATFAALRELYPASFLTIPDDPSVGITFWTDGNFGPIARLRRIEASPWEPIRGNYTTAVQDELDDVMSWHNGPGRDGQLMLWQGPPGTGKTYALRALASEWSSWAEFHYITDPDAFFVDRASYMIDVLLAESYASIDPDTGDVYEEADPEGKWRVLILEDTGELLSAHAKEKYGQGLSRLLNVVDGMIGQGLRVLALVTTNDELSDLNPATTRPGRCASQIVFGSFTDDEARVWSGRDDATGGSLAELYSRYGEDRARPALPERDDVPEPVVASAADPRNAIFEVAEQHVPESGSYGDAWWNASAGTVFWNAADWSTEAEVDAARDAFLAIPGVEDFEWDMEVGHPDGTDAWERVYPGPAEDVALADVIALARQPLPDASGRRLPRSDAEPGVDSLLASLLAQIDAGRAADAPLIDGVGLTAALTALADAHKTTVESIASVLQAAVSSTGDARGDSLTAAALGVLAQFAARPQPAPAPVTVNVPEQAVHVTVEGATVNVPAQEPPVVNVAAASPAPVVFPQIEIPAPVVHVHQPDQQIDVHVPAQAPAQVTFVAAATPPPETRGVRVDYDDQGRKIYVPFTDTEE